MITITAVDFEKLISLLRKDAQQGAPLKFYIVGTRLMINTTDRQGRDLIVTLSDVEYPFMPTKNVTETF
jgi:hypothetical protein